MTLTQSTPAQIQQRFATAYNANAKVPANLGAGGSLGAVVNALESISVDLQQQISYASNLTRLASSASTVPGVNSPDVDTFVNQFLTGNGPNGAFRDPAVSSTLTVTFGVTSLSGTQLQVNVGTYVQTSNGIQFIVIADTNQAGYNAGLNAYVIPAGSTSVDATVQAVVPGTGGNVQARTISQILSLPGAPAPTGISTVTNAAGTSNGFDEESDQACIARFQAEMAGRWATPLGVSAAVSGAQAGLTYQIGDMLDQNGNVRENFFSVIFNVLGQNTGPTSTEIASVSAAVLANGPLGMPFAVAGPTLLPTDVSATLTLVPGADPATVVANANAALSAYLNNIGLVNGVVYTAANASTSAQYSEIIVVLRGVSGVANVTGATLNGGTADVTAAFGTQIVSGNFALATQ